MEMRARSMMLSTAFAFAVSILEASHTSQAPQPSPRESFILEGMVSSDEDFTRQFGPDFEFRLNGHDGYWTVGVYRRGHDTDLTQMTVPWRGPRATTIGGWEFLPGANAPGIHRTFMFSPEVGDTITWDMVLPPAAKFDSKVVFALLDRVGAFGRGEMTISDYKLDGVRSDISSNSNDNIKLLSFRFRVVLSWPATYKLQ
jgi:hypothetical protein